MNLTLIVEPHEILKSKAEPWDFTVDSLAYAADLATEMFRLMKENDGIGLAANQVGVLKRLIVLDVPGFGPRILANPSFEAASTEKVVCEEGCLSVPGKLVKVSRCDAIRVRALDLAQAGAPAVKFRTSGLDAVCIQHEIDHLNGVTISDRAKWEL